jgi:hypothetical protein
MCVSYLDPLQQLMAHCASDELPVELITDLRFTKPQHRRRYRWPATRKAPAFAETLHEVEDFVYERAIMEGLTSYRLITPKIISQDPSLPKRLSRISEWSCVDD